MAPDQAETIALKALAWLVQNDDLFQVFIGSTGADAADLRAAAESPEFLAGVLDFLTMDDAWVIACCESIDQPFEALQRARAALPGGQLPNWT